MVEVAYNRLTITPAEGFDSLPADVLASILSPNGKVCLAQAVPFRLRGAGGYRADKHMDKIWGCQGEFSTDAVEADDYKITIHFSTRYGAAKPYVQSLSKLFPEAVFHLNYIFPDWECGGELTAHSGKVLHKVEEDVATADRARSVAPPEFTEGDYMGMETWDCYARQYPDRRYFRPEVEAWQRKLLETGTSEYISPDRLEAVLAYAKAVIAGKA